MTGVPTPGTPERRWYDLARAHVIGRPDAPDVAATSCLTAVVQRGASDAEIAAVVRGALAGIQDVMLAAAEPVVAQVEEYAGDLIPLAVLTHDGVDGPVTLRRNPDCATGKHATCPGDAWDERPAYDCRIECECICHDAPDCQCGQDGCPNAAAVAQAAAEATYRDVIDAGAQPLPASP